MQYGLQTAFSEIERLSHQVTSAGNPITMDLKTRYVIKGINKEQIVTSVVNIFTTADGSKIERLEDRWDGKLPESGLANVSGLIDLTPYHYCAIISSHLSCVKRSFISPITREMLPSRICATQCKIHPQSSLIE